MDDEAASDTGSTPDALAVSFEGVTKRFSLGRRDILALDDVSVHVPRGSVTALVGPDGAGKTTLLRLAAGLLKPAAGRMSVLGHDPAADPLAVQKRIGYMPQRFGLYEDLSVEENLNLYADLLGVSHKDRADRYPALMHMTGLGPFTKRLAGRLSGGMKQKLGLACVLIRVPPLLLLDEPTVGVDPLSRRELWQIVFSQVKEMGMTVVLSTAYLDEAERCDHVVMLHEGRVLGRGPARYFHDLAKGRVYLVEPKGKPRELQSALLAEPELVDATIDAGRVRVVTQTEQSPAANILADLAVARIQPRLEDGFMTLLRAHAPDGTVATGSHGGAERHRGDEGSDRLDAPHVRVQNLERRFGSFRAVKGITFDVQRGEIFGLLGPNGAGKSTTFRMLCGLLPASAGTLEVAGVNLRTAAPKARAKLGYVAQKFSQYGQLSALENLRFFASAYGLAGGKRRVRIDWAIHEFSLGDMLEINSADLPGGYKQRLAMACALMHEPELLFLDEPTSGVDPLARRLFWQRINRLASAGVTVIVTTHFMEEAEYCDRIAIMVGGDLLALGMPEQIRQRGAATETAVPTIEQAFIALVEQQRENEEEAA